MAVLWAICRSDLRRRVASTLALAALIGLVVGAALLGVTAARRTDSALDRFLVASRTADASLFAFGLDPTPVRAHPDVMRSGVKAYVFVLYPDLPGNNASTFRSLDGAAFDSIDAGVVVAGRRAHEDRPEEVVISPGMAARHGLHVGARLRGQLPTANDLERCFTTGDCRASGAERLLRVVGIVRQPLDLAPQPDVDAGPIWLTNDETVYVTAAFDPGPQEMQPAVEVTLRHGERDLETVRRTAIDAAPPDAPVSTEVTSTITASARRSLRTQAGAAAALGILAAAAAVAGIGQMVARDVRTAATDWGALRSLGVRDRQLVGASVLRLLPAVGAGSALAVLAAYLGSAATPIGPARPAEPSPGLRFDGVALLLGALVTIVVLCSVAAAAAWWTCRRLRPSRSAGRGRAERPIAARLPLPVTVGGHLARRADSGGAHRSVRLGVAAVAVGLVLVTGLLEVLASFDHLVATPAGYGWSGDLLVGNPNGGALDDVVEPVLAADERVARWSSATFLELELDGHRLPALAADTTHGRVLPPIVDGRAPSAPDEVAVGGRTLHRLHLALGDVVQVSGPVGRHPMRVVGTTVLGPPNGLAANVGVAGPGEGILLEHGALDGLVTPDEAVRHVFFVDARPGADVPSLAAHLRERVGPNVLPPVVTGDLLALQEVTWLPMAVAALLLTLAAATLAQALGSTVRARRRELGTLKAIGFARRQLVSAVVVLAALLVAGPLAVAAPLGVAAGRVTWRALADGIGVASGAVLPSWPLVAVALGAIAAAVAIALPPGRWAARTPAAQVLRIE
jgi:hypothetical protein